MATVRQHNSTYIGHTTTLGRRFTMHLHEGEIKRDMTQNHNTKLTRTDLTNTTIMDRCTDKRKLHVLEKVYIRDCDPSINRQVGARGTVPVFKCAPLGARLLSRRGVLAKEKSRPEP